jgi:hypothetical protein
VVVLLASASLAIPLLGMTPPGIVSLMNAAPAFARLT